MDFSVRIAIRNAYKLVEKDLLKGARICPYGIGIDWMGLFSPIEDYVWGAIRYLGVPLYPQYPVGPYFLDFADPFRRIGMEVDSFRWHRNISNDIKRQREIEKMRWRIYRIPFYKTFKIRDDFYNDEGI